jgi:Holliday junction DNA helicase RuvA
VETGGIGFLVYAPTPVLSSLGRPGDEVYLQTLLIVREDALTLYGFATPEQRSTFETLLSVTGVGPRVALNLLSSATPEEIRLAVAQNDTARLSRVPGIGKKLAERLMLELKGKLNLKDLPSIATGGAPAVVAVNNELIELLVTLGYSSTEATSAVASLPADAPLDIEERLRFVLRYFGSA